MKAVVATKGMSRPGTLARRMQDAVLQVLREHEADGMLPTNLRFVFYELETRGLVRKSREGEPRRGSSDDPREQEVTDAALYLRKAGLVPWGWLTDETRTLHDWQHAPSVAEFVLDSVYRARINPWPSDPPLLLVESRSLGGVLNDLAWRYLCPIAATNGQVGGFLYTDVVPTLAANDRAVLYLGDWDHQGHQIEVNTRRVLEREAGRPIGWTRIAITQEQIEARGLEPIWKTDARYRPPLKHYAWETEALGQRTIVDLVSAALDALLPEPIDDVLEREREQMGEVAALLEELVP
jgi:hypothetical protein